MNREKISFMRWLLEGLKNIPHAVVSMLKEPSGEVALGCGMLFIIVLALPILYSLGILAIIGAFAFSFLVCLHGIYRDDVK